MDCRYLLDVARHTKPTGSSAVGPQLCAGYVICNNGLRRTTVVYMAMIWESLWTSWLWWWGRITRSCTLFTITLNCQWWQPQSSTQEALYKDPQCTGIRFLGLVELDEQPTEKCLQFNCSCGEASPILTLTVTPIHTQLCTQLAPYNQPCAHVFKWEIMMNNST